MSRPVFVRSAFAESDYRKRHALTRRDGALMHVRAAPSMEARQEKDGDDYDVVYGLGLKWDTPALVYGEWEQFRKGAFATTLRDHDQFLLVEHNYDEVPLSRTGEYMEMWEGDTGLNYEARVARVNPRGLAFVDAVTRGLMDKASIGFGWTTDYEYDSDFELDGSTGLYTYTDVKRLYEVSGVKWPAHESSELGARDAVDGADEKGDKVRNQGRGVDKVAVDWDYEYDKLRSRDRLLDLH